ncbi:AI-2E family transporter [bacterium]|nr:AI-2E family transporter [bacterium]
MYYNSIMEVFMFRKKDDVDTKGLNEIINLSKNILKLLFILLIIGIILAGIIIFKELGIFKLLRSVLNVLSPLFIGFVIAWLFAPLVDKMTRKGTSRILASITVYIIFILFLTIFFRIFIPVIYKELNELISSLPNITEKITIFVNSMFDKIDNDMFDVKNVKENILDAILSYGNNISSNFPTLIVTFMSNFVSGIGTIFFGLIIGLYMLFDFDNVTNLLLRLIPVKHQVEVASLVENIGVEVRKCVNGTLLVACMVFVCDTIGFSIIGLKSALLFGLFCGITDLIPYIGPYLGTCVATIVGLTQSPLIGICTFVVAVIVQLIESYILQPVVMSKATNLHPVTIICSLLIFGHFFGIVGMVLATPIMSIFKVITIFVKEKVENKQKIIEEA